MAAADPRRRARVIAAACALATACEGTVLHAYPDPALGWQLPTACMGHTAGVQRGQIFTLEQCRALLDADMGRSFDAVAACAPGAPDGVLEALADFGFNAGTGRVCDPRQSTLARYVATRSWRQACDELPKWNRAGGRVLAGLVKRREQERGVCLRDLPAT